MIEVRCKTPHCNRLLFELEENSTGKIKFPCPKCKRMRAINLATQSADERRDSEQRPERRL